MAPTADATGVIHDIGYQRYTGPRLGRRYIVGSLYVHGLRTAFGIGRGFKAKLFPWAITGIITVVAAVLIVIRSLSGEMPVTYPGFAEAVSVLLILFLATAAPELVSRDLGAGVLPLYFSRPLRRLDYPLAKLASLTSAVWLLIVGPLLLMYAGGAFSRDDGLLGAWRELGDLVPGLLYAAMYAIVLSSLALLVASAAKRRAFAAGAVVAAFLITTPVVGVLIELGSPHTQQLAALGSPLTLLTGLRWWLFESAESEIGGYGPIYGLVAVTVVASCVALLIARYRKVAS
ncbi:MAG TPA: ABC transporter permease [Micromonosporaceae bacterium]|nr:ABC transporter permease [Micromonosporaceae bacterium]